jgi:hypothetical protein
MTNANSDSTCSADVHRDPLASHIDGFAVLLRGQGYVAETVRQKCALLADLSQWLGVRGLSLNKLDEALVARFHTDRCPPDRQQMRRGRAATTSQILNYLRDLGCIPTPSVTIGSSPVDVLLGDYEKFLRSERGLAPATLKNYLPIVQRFLRRTAGGGPPWVHYSQCAARISWTCEADGHGDALVSPFSAAAWHPVERPRRGDARRRQLASVAFAEDPPTSPG